MSYKYLARQPIVEMDGKLFAYEMLYRDSEENLYPRGTDDDASTRAMICNMQTDFDLRSVTGGKRAFINLTKQMCMSDIVLLLRPEEFIIEILESTWVDSAFIQQIQNLKEQGYAFALDDYIGQESFNALIPFMDIIKVDFAQMDRRERRAVARRFAGKKLLAEKIETEEDYRQAKLFGYDLAQGYYFSKPVLLKTETIGISTVTHLKLWEAMNRIEPRYDQIADIIMKDAGMTFRLFNKAQTLQFYRGEKTDSVRHALVRMGAEELKRWLMLILLQECLSGQNDEYIRLALSRAEFIESLYKEIKRDKQYSDAYLAGMFSVFEPEEAGALASLLEQLKLNKEIEKALLHNDGFMGKLLAFTRDYERGYLDSLELAAREYGIRQERIVELYKSSVEYADQVFQSVI